MVRRSPTTRRSVVRQWALLGILGLALLPGLAACGTGADPSAQAAAIDTAAETDDMAVNLYQPDGNCKGLIAQSVKLPRDRALEAAVGRVLIQATASNGETFDLRHYRFSLDTSRRESTIDLRLNPETRRRFQSLSSCEQLTLFGSVQATLTRNRHWPIDRVIFTDNGQRLDW